jgi:putative phage-type endonuclease
MSLSDEDKKLIGGSDVAALVGLHPYKGPVDVWRRIVEGFELPDSPQLRRGRMLEPSVLAWYAEDTGTVLRPGRIIRNWWKRASLDGEATRDGIDRVVEAKTCNIQTAQRCGEGPEDVPEEWLPQVTWYMGETGLPLADIAALLAGDELRHYTIPFDAGFYDVLCEAAARFYQDYVLPKRPPPMDGMPGTSDWLNQRFPQNSAPLLVATPEAEEIARRLRIARDAKAAAETEEKKARQELEGIIKTADGISGTGWRVTWKTTKGAAKTDWEAAAKDFGVPEDIIQKHTTIRPGSRRFVPTWKDEK